MGEEEESCFSPNLRSTSWNGVVSQLSKSPVRDNETVRNSVSIQICTLNEADNIGACLEAVWANQPDEVIVIDGGSTDSTVEIARSHGARVLSPGRLGLGPSRQLGYGSTECLFSAFIDADDRIPPDWLAVMMRELEEGDYSALQSCLRALPEASWWDRGWDEYFTESVKPRADSPMIGRPALFRTADLLRVDTDLASLDEDTHLSRAFELMGLRQGIGSAVAYRRVERTWAENSRKWRSYGRGYRGFVDDNPDRRAAILRHMWITIPLVRGFRPVLRGHVTQPVFAFLMAYSIIRGWQERV